jgi:hypothetical protein
MAKHRTDYQQWKKKNSRSFTRSFVLFEEYGIKNCIIELIEAKPCIDKNEQAKLEGSYIRTLECVNKNIPGRTRQEYKEDNKEKIKTTRKEFYEKNKDKLNTTRKEYYEENKDKCKETAKEYRVNNKEKIKAKDNAYYAKNKELIKERRAKHKALKLKQ